MSSFQIIVTSVFVAFIVIGMGAFALLGGLGGSGGVGPITVWGTLGQADVQTVLSVLVPQDKTLSEVTYVSLDEDAYIDTLVDAMASGRGPDLFFFTPEEAGALADKLIPIPYSVVPQGTFMSSYIDEGRLFLNAQGTVALPFVVDPLVMYWNRDLFTAAGLTQPPQYWNDLIVMAPKITSLDAGSVVRKSAVAMGAWSNVAHAKAVLSTLFMQSGDFITTRNDIGTLVPAFGLSPATDEALRFYTDFANPSKTTYSWNRSLPLSYDAFVAGDLAVYFGYASEYGSISERNPNLRFSAATMPQLMGSAAKITYGRMTGLAVSRGARNPQGAMTIAQRLTSPQAAAALARQLGLPPARIDVALDTSSSAAMATFVQSALWARGWIDPNRSATDDLFKVMIESVLSSRSDPSRAVAEASRGLLQLLPPQ